MTPLQIVVLSVIQGLTEFLPVSSSAHLILGSKAFGWPDQGLVFDVATHLGTLLAVLVYFRRDLVAMIAACLRAPRDRADRDHRAMVFYLALASLPALLAGIFLHDLVEQHLRNVRVIAWTTIAFGLVLWVADAAGGRSRDLRRMTWARALLVGVAQALALIPGVSRSGITITAGLFLGFTPQTAARFSFLLAIPVISAAGLFGALRVANGDTDVQWSQFALALGLSAAAGWVCIAGFLALLRRVGLLPFVLYRLALGLGLLWLAR